MNIHERFIRKHTITVVVGLLLCWGLWSWMGSNLDRRVPWRSLPVYPGAKGVLVSASHDAHMARFSRTTSIPAVFQWYETTLAEDIIAMNQDATSTMYWKTYYLCTGMKILVQLEVESIRGKVTMTKGFPHRNPRTCRGVESPG
ncbi:hypothetical protein ACP8Y2_06800 [Herpetosiphon llansteffanensis]